MDQAVNGHITITVLLPVYNSRMYLRETIDSILSQTFRDFELLIINDGSTDESQDVIDSYTDPRIRATRNDGNKGLIFTLNKGINLARGEYIARIDGDDVCLPERLEVQLRYFRENPSVSVVCSPIIAINERGKETRGWAADSYAKTEEQIRETLPKENCIAHPSVLIKTSVAKTYKYNPSQKGSEDWDLWMRLASDGHRILKTQEPLLKYRYLSSGVTLSDKKAQFVEIKVLNVKRKFLAQQLGKFKITRFEWKVMYSILRTMARHLKLNVLPVWLRPLKRLFTINPVRAYAQYKALKAHCNNAAKVDLFFFFPYCHIGGAEKVHANIVEVFSGKRTVVFFTNISGREGFLPIFQKFSPSFNIGFCLNHPFFASASSELILQLIHKQEQTTVFGCNSMFFYENVLGFKKNVRVFDLMHDFRFEHEDNITHQFKEQYERCDQRIFISSKAIEQTKLFYDFVSMPEKEYDKLLLIPNYVDVPDVMPLKSYEGNLKVLYVGRGSEEKRAHLFAAIAGECKEKNKQLEFTAVGELSQVMSADGNYLRLPGPVYDFEKLKIYYEHFHIIVITSSREGFPMSIMEGMAHGMIALSTPVGDVPKHISAETGFVTSSLAEDVVIAEMSRKIGEWNADRETLKQMSFNAYEYAKRYFSRARFFESYRKLIGL